MEGIAGTGEPSRNLGAVGTLPAVTRSAFLQTMADQF